MPRDQIIVMNLCGRGDKDIFTVGDASGNRAVSGRIDAAVRASCAGRGQRGRSSPSSGAGDPDPATSPSILRGLPGAGADVVEIGMPFTDPMADGPSIQRRPARAEGRRDAGHDASTMVRDFRRRSTPTPDRADGLLQPDLSYGVERFLTDAAAAGVDGLIVVDLPPEEDGRARACRPRRRAST